MIIYMITISNTTTATTMITATITTTATTMITTTTTTTTTTLFIDTEDKVNNKTSSLMIIVRVY